ncbi:MAG: hypothetical protein IJW20_01300 [Clostridia bacterium]|nr:hypothetical protein [Clostridia bacterium]
MNIVKKISLVLLILIVAISICCTSVRADDASANANFDLEAFDNTSAPGADKANNMVNNAAAQIISMARIVCVTIAIVMLLVIAMKYMISAPGDRADIKKHAVNYVIGAFVLFGVSGILTVLNNVAQTIGS